MLARIALWFGLLWSYFILTIFPEKLAKKCYSSSYFDFFDVDILMTSLSSGLIDETPATNESHQKITVKISGSHSDVQASFFRASGEPEPSVFWDFWLRASLGRAKFTLGERAGRYFVLAGT